ncbi:MAG: sugar phosphate nucleotidyltransferase [Balneolaceae bacterium]|nr:sugar phosphate nucleotidyltransferase [Balneolaceae bacterium]
MSQSPRIIGVLMAGGSGTRFWPKSIASKPKQFLSLFGDKTMLQDTVDRLDGWIQREDWRVVTNASYRALVQNQLPWMTTDQILGEPVAKNTAPCIAAAAASVSSGITSDGEGLVEDPVMVVMPSDHVIQDPRAFQSVLDHAVRVAAESDALVTIGITPTHPETGYGYIQFEAPNDSESGSSPAQTTEMGIQDYNVKAFREKPDRQTAQSYLEQGSFVWNSGLFVWRLSSFMGALKEAMPELYNQCELLASKGLTEEAIRKFFEGAESISIDYGLMEKANNVRVVPGEFGWNDVGSWTAAYDLATKDANGNASNTEALISVNASNNYIDVDDGTVVGIVGVEGMAVVQSGERLLVCPIDQAQEVKKVVDQLKKR